MDQSLKIPPKTKCYILTDGGGWTPYQTKREVVVIKVLDNILGVRKGHTPVEVKVEDSDKIYPLQVPNRWLFEPAELKVESESEDGVFYRLELNERGEATRCSCRGFSYRRKCKHIQNPGHAAFRAAWRVLWQAGIQITEIKLLWNEAQARTNHEDCAAARFAWLAAQALTTKED